MSIEQYEALHREQNGRCAICGSKDPGGVKSFLVVDHEHTGQKRVRGLLCANCNSGLGMFGDDIARICAAADYLKRFQ